MPRVNSLWLYIVVPLVIIVGLVILAVLSSDLPLAFPAGVGFLVMVSYLCVVGVLRWAATSHRFPRHLFRPAARRRGFTLLSSVTAAAIVMIAMTVTLQMLLTAARSRQAQTARLDAMARAVTAIEQARLSLLSSSDSFRPHVAPGLRVTVSQGPVPGTATLDATVSLPAGATLSLTTIAPAPHGAPHLAVPAQQTRLTGGGQAR